MEATARPGGLPAPTGPHAVGRTSSEWVDTSRPEIYSSDPGDHREFVVWIWYPATAGHNAEPTMYLPQSWAPVGDFLGLDTAGVTGHAMADPPVAGDGSEHPVLVLSPSGFSPLLLTAVAEEIASHGYVVVGVNHTYESTVTVFSDGRVVPMSPAAVAGVLGPQTGPYQERFRQRAAVCDNKAADLASVADQLERLGADGSTLLAGRLDLGRLGAFGHSFGGNAALQWCRNDARCRAAVNLDGALWTEVGTLGLDRPALQLLAEHPEFALSSAEAVQAGIASDAEAYEVEKKICFSGWRTVHQRANPGYTLQVKGATHLSFMDLGFLPVHRPSPIASTLDATRIEPSRMWRITCDVLLAFFSRHMDGSQAPLLDDPSSQYPELIDGPP